MKKVLVTGFDPFGGESLNPALESVKQLPNIISGAEVIKLEVPTVFKKSVDTLQKAMEKENPDVIICVGQAGGRTDITIERVAINQDDARIPDNEGNSPIDEVIFEDGENAYFASLPIKAMAKEIQDSGIPASISNTAGTYVCNHLMYGCLYWIDKKYKNAIGGFIHVPFVMEQVVNKRNMAAMNIKDITRALEIAIKAALENKEDIKTTGGDIC